MEGRSMKNPEDIGPEALNMLNGFTYGIEEDGLDAALDEIEAREEL